MFITPVQKSNLNKLMADYNIEPVQTSSVIVLSNAIIMLNNLKEYNKAVELFNDYVTTTVDYAFREIGYIIESLKKNHPEQLPELPADLRGAIQSKVVNSVTVMAIKNNHLRV